MEKNYSNKRILVTGGAGYIGSHTCVELIEAGFQIVVIDNLSNSSEKSLKRVAEIVNSPSIEFYKGDIRDSHFLTTIFEMYPFQAVIHFAGLKAVGESVAEPLMYYDNNVSGTVSLLKVMKEFQVKRLIFSSSATVYGDPVTTPIKEDFDLHTTNPYGQSKLMIENILKDIQHANPDWQIALLRYFNPIGAHSSAKIGENPNGTPNNLMPYIARVATGQYPYLSVFGNDYPTHDGTGIRDYIHVVDLAKGHVAALNAFLSDNVPNMLIVNLGTGNGYSVLDMIHSFEQANGVKIPYKIVGRRSGDIATCYADATQAFQLLKWKANISLHDMCKDTWNWQRNNPNGYVE